MKCRPVIDPYFLSYLFTTFVADPYFLANFSRFSGCIEWYSGISLFQWIVHQHIQSSSLCRDREGMEVT